MGSNPTLSARTPNIGGGRIVGLVRRFAKPLGEQSPRGFESLPPRQQVKSAQIRRVRAADAPLTEGTSQDYVKVAIRILDPDRYAPGSVLLRCRRPIGLAVMFPRQPPPGRCCFPRDLLVRAPQPFDLADRVVLGGFESS